MNNITYLTQNFQAIHKIKPLREESDEFPSFDEAFNQDNLREFFRSTDVSTHSPSSSTRKLTNFDETNTMGFTMSYSPYKEHFYDDTQHSVADTNDTYISPQKDLPLTEKNQYMQLAQDSNLKKNLDMSSLDSYTQGIYAALNGVNYSNNIHSGIPMTGGLEVLANKENLSNTKNKQIKKKVFLIIRNSPPLIVKSEIPSKKVSDKSSVTNVEKGSRRGKGQRRVKDRLKSLENINLNNYFNTNEINNESLKRKSSYATSEDLRGNKKVKIQKDPKGNLDGTFEFDLDADKDFKPGYFDILPTISFDEIINREYPEFTGNALDNNFKH